MDGVNKGGDIKTGRIVGERVKNRFEAKMRIGEGVDSDFESRLKSGTVRTNMKVDGIDAGWGGHVKSIGEI